jgi:hypothetical protein
MRFQASVDIAREPGVVLADWRALEIQVPGLAMPVVVLVGRIVKTHRARVSSWVSHLDRVNGVVGTTSGRAYRLQGLPSTQDDMLAFIYDWAQLHGVTVVADRSLELLASLGGVQ